jgi:hypothetical protein
VAVIRPAAVLALVLITSCNVFRRQPESAPSPTRRARVEREGQINSTRSLVRAMQAHYGRRWFSTLTFVQQNTRSKAGGGQERTRWAEYVSVPGKLRVEFLPWTMRSGVLYESGRVHTFDNGRRIDSRSQDNPLLLLTADVYALPVETAVARLQESGIATRRFSEARWRGRRVYVIGAESGDLTSTQAWIDADRMVVVRWIERESVRGRAIVTDTHFENYRTVSGYPVAHEIVVHRDGRPFWRAEYTNVKVNVALSPSLFSPTRWRDAPRPSQSVE